MVRPENISSKIEQMRRYRALLTAYSSMDFAALLQDPEKLGACERFLFLLCQCAIDAAEMLCKLKNLSRPETMSESFDRLNQAGIIDNDIAILMTRMVGFRNALSHAYDKFNYTIMKDVLTKHLDDFSLFSKAVERALAE
jgi:uncharacterized protein YutE (UPF0331/DUF86 family)